MKQGCGAVEDIQICVGVIVHNNAQLLSGIGKIVGCGI
jgi:hypothetical protein